MWGPPKPYERLLLSNGHHHDEPVWLCRPETCLISFFYI